MLTIAVDGSALGNPGPAGWAWYIDDDNWASGGWESATNNQGELMAVIQALEATANHDADIHFLADSQYVINSITKWMAGWKRKGWKKADGKPVSNQEFMIRLDELMTAAKDAGKKVTFEWVKGHSNHELNEKVDTLAHAAATAFKNKTAPKAGPGLTLAGGAGSSANTSDASSRETDPQPSKASEETVTVHCPVEKELADLILQHAQKNRRTPHEELASLIRTGAKISYGV